VAQLSRDHVKSTRLDELVSTRCYMIGFVWSLLWHRGSTNHETPTQGRN